MARRAPERTCIGCRQTAGKRALVRVVRTAEGNVQVDQTGRRNGRGAYLHADPACWRTALGRDALTRALHTAVAPADREALEAYAAALPNRDSATP
ncbi:MAG: YlxR family protein [Dehalococcoidia bacterium]|nr:YlxR family protein [Dehalococcoidia bacterium]